jgi:hypothetical protein
MLDLDPDPDPYYINADTKPSPRFGIRYLSGLVNSLVCEGAGPAHNANTALLVDVAGHDS